MEAPFSSLALAALASLLAGFVDAIVGGGGLIQLPALLVLFPSADFAQLSSVNKAASCAGTLFAFLRYSRHVPLSSERLLPGCALAFLASGIGAVAAAYAPTSAMRVFALVASISVAGVTLLRPKALAVHGNSQAFSGFSPMLKVSVLAVGIGFYDGFFGPGTGTFFVFGLVSLLGLSFLQATAETKALNLATNLAAIATFASLGAFEPKLFVPLACCNIAGSLLGTRMAIKHGSKFVRKVFLVVVTVLILRMTYGVVLDVMKWF